MKTCLIRSLRFGSVRPGVLALIVAVSCALCFCVIVLKSRNDKLREIDYLHSRIRTLEETIGAKAKNSDELAALAGKGEQLKRNTEEIFQLRAQMTELQRLREENHALKNQLQTGRESNSDRAGVGRTAPVETKSSIPNSQESNASEQTDSRVFKHSPEEAQPYVFVDNQGQTVEWVIGKRSGLAVPRTMAARYGLTVSTDGQKVEPENPVSNRPIIVPRGTKK